MRFVTLLLVIISYFSVINAQGSVANCKFSGQDYGFLANGTGYSSSDSANQYTYYWNICKTAQKCNPMNTGSIAACQIKNGATNPTITAVGMIGQGTFSSTTENKANVKLNYKTSTNPCSNGSFRNMDIYIVCGNTNSVGQIIEESKCQYGVVQTTNKCSGGNSGSGDNSGSHGGSGDSGKKKSGMGGGWIFIIILVSCTAAYLIGGVIFNAKVKGLRGSEMLPNKEFWSNFGGLIKDGVFYIKSKVSGSPSGYQQV